MHYSLARPAFTICWKIGYGITTHTCDLQMGQRNESDGSFDSFPQFAHTSTDRFPFAITLFFF